MPDLFHLTPEMNQYFNALPESVKENIIQSGAKINSLEDLKAVAAQLCNHAAYPPLSPSGKQPE